MSGSNDPEILNIEQAAALLGVSVKTFNKVLHSQDLPARKIGREWKFSRRHLIDWVGAGLSSEFYREHSSDSQDGVVTPQPTATTRSGSGTSRSGSKAASAESDNGSTDAFPPSEDRRTSGWRLQHD